jgi:hypothetical protein
MKINYVNHAYDYRQAKTHYEGILLMGIFSFSIEKIIIMSFFSILCIYNYYTYMLQF